MEPVKLGAAALIPEPCDITVTLTGACSLLPLQITFFMLLSAVCVMLNLAGSILSCQNAQLVDSLDSCQLVKFVSDGVCVCCEPQLPNSGCNNLGETLKLNPLRDCNTIRMRLKELLFSVCALNVISTIVCALATAMCCMQMVSADILQMFMLHRTRAPNADCLTPHGMETQRGLHLEFPHSLFSAIYGLPTNSPGTLYPTELPPPYESVVGQTPAELVTSLEQQATESSRCERYTAGDFSTPASADQASLMASGGAHLPSHCCSSEDLSSLEVQDSPHSTSDLSLSPTTALTDGSCTNPELSGVGAPHSHAQAPSPDRLPEAVITLPQERPKLCRERASRTLVPPPPPPPSALASASACAPLPNPPLVPTPSLSAACSPSPSPPTRPRGHKLRFSVWAPSSSSSSASQPAWGSRSSRRCRRLARIVRSSSDPISCASLSGSDSCSCASAHSPPENSQQTSPEPAACSEQTALVLSLPSAKPGIFGVRKPKDGAKADIRVKPRPPHTLSSERPHSLADLKTYKDTKVLVAKFLEHSSCSLPPEVRQVVNNIKFVIKSDERHMEEAMFSANIIDQVMMQSQHAGGHPRKHACEELHLQSCGALSSPSAPLRRSRGPVPHLSGLPLPKPPGPELAPTLTDCAHSLVSVCRETIL
ncbi:hypothetical protein GJAV_G00250860 [Gymnothorax javanicus]|nr:hypothetical protein GJAV_G00250860 [Gymnothorax javanicus]